ERVKSWRARRALPHRRARAHARSAGSGVDTAPEEARRIMLRSLRELEGYALGATDGEIGKVVDFLFDDERWAIRYLVADTGGWLSGRRVLLSPMSLAGADWSTRCLRVMLSRERIQNSPSIDAE